MLSKKKSNMPLMVGILGGVTALIAVLVGLTIYITMNRGRTDDDKLVATNTSAGKKGAKTEHRETNPGEATAEGEADADAKTPAPATKTAKKEARVVESREAVQVAALKGIREWKDAAKLVSIKIGNAKISFNRIWLSADAGGTSTRRVETPTAASAEKETSAEPPAAAVDSAGGAPKYVFVEVTVANTAGAPLKYKGWNIAKTKVPFMADGQDQILKLVPASETPDVARLTKADIPGGTSISDVLVFEAPTESFEKLRLVLPQNVLYDNTKNPYFGIEFTAAVLDNEGGPPVAVPPLAAIAGDEGNDPLVSGRTIPGDPRIRTA